MSSVSLEISAPSLEDIFLEADWEEGCAIEPRLWPYLVAYGEPHAPRDAQPRVSVFQLDHAARVSLRLRRAFQAVSVPKPCRILLSMVLALTVMGSFWGLSVQLVTFREQGDLCADSVLRL